MTKFMRRAAAALAATLAGTALATIPTAPAAATYTCGVHHHRGWVQIINAGNTVYTITDINIHYRNCSSVTQRKRPDIALGPDLDCATVTPYTNRRWTYRDNSRDLSSYRGLVNC